MPRTWISVKYGYTVSAFSCARARNVDVIYGLTISATSAAVSLSSFNRLLNIVPTIRIEDRT